MWFYQENIWKKSEKLYQKNPTKSYKKKWKIFYFCKCCRVISYACMLTHERHMRVKRKKQISKNVRIWSYTVSIWSSCLITYEHAACSHMSMPHVHIWTYRMFLYDHMRASCVSIDLNHMWTPIMFIYDTSIWSYVCIICEHWPKSYVNSDYVHIYISKHNQTKCNQ